MYYWMFVPYSCSLFLQTFLFRYEVMEGDGRLDTADQGEFTDTSESRVFYYCKADQADPTSI